MNPGCWLCIHYKPKCHYETRGIRNVSGDLAKFLVWDKDPCELKQKDKYPNHCGYKENKVLRAKLEKKYGALGRRKCLINYMKILFLENESKRS